MMSSRLPLVQEDAVERTRGLGVLKVRKGNRQRTLPLAGVDVRARVAERVALVTMTQTFQNPMTESLEAVYIFPLAGGSAVSAFEMKVGDRVIKGKVRERGEARQQYEKARDQGKRAALLEQERDDVFTVQVGNLPPGEEITVRITVSERLPFFEDGRTELRLPFVVAPRYIPGAPVARDPVGDGVEWDTDEVPDASRITPPRLAPGFDPKVALGIRVELEGGDLADLVCSQHATRTSTAKGGTTIELAQEDEPLNRDFVLRWRLAAGAVRPSFLVHRGTDGRATGMLTIVPPKRDGFLGLARDVVFVLDRSGSMAGAKMASAARACSILLSTLGPRDRFAIVAFDDRNEWFAPSRAEDRYFLRADEAGVQQGDAFLRGIEDRGGTELDGALREAMKALKGRREPGGRMPVIALLTDGQVGDESRVLKRIQKELGDVRVFTVGIDTAVNEGFLRRLAVMGGGTSTFVVPGEALEAALRDVGREIGTPLVTDLAIDGDPADLAPARIPDLFAGRAVTAFFTGASSGPIRVRGKAADGSPFESIVEPQELDLEAILHLWARTRVADLEDRFRLEGADRDAIRKEIVDLAVCHTLLTRFTAFVVVDEHEIVNETGDLRKVVQPVEMPARWEMDMVGAFSCDAVVPGQELRSVECRMTLGPPSPPAAARPAGGRGIFGRTRKREQKADARPKGDPKEEKKIREAVRRLDEAMVKARAELAAGRIPDVRPVEKARAELMKLLSGSDLGQLLPRLQRFLRGALVEILAALHAPGISPADLGELFERHAAEWTAAKSEKASSQDASFWEATV